MLGGLLSSSDSVQERGIPLLQKIPLFRWQEKTTDNTELLFIITPQVIEQASGQVGLPPLEYHEAPNHLGKSGLDANGVPYTFAGEQGTVLGRSPFCLEVRDAPNDNSSRLADCLLPGTDVIVMKRQDDWLQVHAPTGEEGWVLRRWIHLAVEKP